MSKKRNPDHRPLSRDEIKKLAIAAGCSDPKQPFNFGRHATLIYRLIGEVLRGRRDKAVAGTKELSAAIAGRRVGTEGDDKLKMLERIAQAASFVISAHTMVHPHMSREEAERQSMNTLNAALGPWQATQCASTATQADGGT